jgi:hypothetical protein
MGLRRIATFACHVALNLLAAVAASDDRAEALALIERLGGCYHVETDKPGKPVVAVAMSKVGLNGEGPFET